jgi:signal transduction histidine kinase
MLNRQKTILQKEKEKQHHLRLQAIVNTQEEVQQNIARDIHDGLVQVLGAAKISLQAINMNGDKDVIHERIKDASMIIDEACIEARNISHQILPYSLVQDGLFPAVDELLKKSLRDVSYQFDFSGMAKRLDKDIEINMYRIAQELIQNVLKHSSATHVEVQLEYEQSKLSLSVKDNGKGYDPGLIKSNSVGLTNIRTRTELIRGTFKMDSAVNLGTKVSVEVPL